MKYILYYSNFCKHCETIISVLSKSKIKDSIYFVNIDNRAMENGKMYVILQNGKKLALPKNVKEVPSLILLHQGNIVLEGTQISDYFKDSLRKEESYEPMAFSMDEMNGMSDGYSYLDMTSDQMTAKGDGGTRIMHSFASLQGQSTIETPPDNYEPNKVGDVNLEILQEKRNAEIPRQM